MHSEVRAAIDQGLGDLGDKGALAPDRSDRAIAVPVAGRLDDDDLGRDPSG